MVNASYPSENEKQVILAAEEKMKSIMAQYDPSHDALHVQRVRKTALSIAQTLEPSPDFLVIEISALFHDLLDKKYIKEANIDAYAFFLPFFSSVASHVNLIDDGRAKEIVRIVENVSWTNEKKLRSEGKWTEWHDKCVELHCVQDADRLDAIGAFGIMRCAAYSAVTNRPLHVPTGSETAFADNAIHHFYDKLLLIKDRLKTEVGKLMGEKRHRMMLDFLKAVEEEYDGVIP